MSLRVLGKRIMNWLEKQRLDLSNLNVGSMFLGGLGCPLEYGARCKDFLAKEVRDTNKLWCSACYWYRVDCKGHGHCVAGHDLGKFLKLIERYNDFRREKLF
jgi:hypothetical protein